MDALVAEILVAGSGQAVVVMADASADAHVARLAREAARATRTRDSLGSLRQKIEAVAAACEILCTGRGGLISGQVVHVNGGRYRYWIELWPPDQANLQD